MLLTSCNTAEKTAEITTTTTAETTVTTTATTAAITEKQTSLTSKETEITQATKDTPNTSESEVYLFDYQSLYEIAPSEKEQFEILENVFYGEWESDRISNDKFFTYRNCYFDFAGACSLVCFMEIDKGYVLPYICGGVFAAAYFLSAAANYFFAAAYPNFAVKSSSSFSHRAAYIRRGCPGPQWSHRRGLRR